MIRLALPKGRNLGPSLAALREAGVTLDGLSPEGRRLRQRFPDEGIEVLLLKDWDLPLYVEYGVAEWGIVGSDVLGETGADLLRPVRLLGGGSRLSLVGRPGAEPVPGSQIRLATKYTASAHRFLASAPFSAEVMKLSGSVELAPVLDLADLALDIVQTGRTIREHGLVELQVVEAVAPTVVVGRAAYQLHRRRINAWIDELERAEVAV
ncbi:MAG: ATP phosphoribosyltransferase [Thermoanaerobaculia bacterium]|nr:ATP phosphoribosyltransferase [Thermoanaerobaculia bacterium]